MRLAAAIALYLAMIAIEALSPRPRRSEADLRDDGTLLWFAVAIHGGVAAGIAVAAILGPWAGGWAPVAGVCVMIGGGALRVWSIRTLGRFFTREVQVAADQPVIEAGPYRWVRHPSYSALIVELTGIAVVLGHPLAGLICVAPTVIAIARRVPVEEKALQSAIGARWDAYVQRTTRFIPGVL